MCDAWFDVALSWGTPGESASIALALIVELPLASALWILAPRLGGILKSTSPAHNHVSAAELSGAWTPDVRRVVQLATGSSSLDPPIAPQYQESRLFS
jgi:hypothetical protein